MIQDQDLNCDQEIEEEMIDSDEELEDRFEDEELTRNIRERLRAFRYEMYRGNAPVEEEF